MCMCVYIWHACLVLIFKVLNKYVKQLYQSPIWINNLKTLLIRTENEPEICVSIFLYKKNLIIDFESSKLNFLNLLILNSKCIFYIESHISLFLKYFVLPQVWCCCGDNQSSSGPG